MGDPITSIVVAAGVSWWQGEEAKKEQRRAEQRQQEAEKRAELIADAQRQADIATRKRQEDVLPPIIGSQATEAELGVAALEFNPDDTMNEIGVQIGSTDDTGGSV